jgi:cysteinyl-tRNA synthetase
VRHANAVLDEPGTEAAPAERAREALALFDACLGIVDEAAVTEPRRFSVPLVGVAGAPESTVELAFDPASEDDREIAWLVERLSARVAARKGRNFAESDAIREEAAARGYVVEDTAAGQVVRRPD